jgi:hypothetical protein
MQWLRTCVHFLSERSLMDYSMMVSCLHLDLEDPTTPGVLAALEDQRAATVHGSATSPWPFVSVLDVGDRRTAQVLHVGVIDFLQDWTMAKNVAMCIKACEQNKATVPPDEYGARFIRVQS